MREEYISDALNMLDDAIIKEVDKVRSRVRNQEVKDGRNVLETGGFESAGADIGYKSKKRKEIAGWRRWGWYLAGICFVLVVCIKMGAQDLPLLTITEDIGEGMGFEGYMVYDVSELMSANPWNENMEIATLPVYQNPVVYEDFCVVSGADYGKMEEFLIEVAERLGIETDGLVITDDAPGQEEQEAIKRKAEGNLPEGYFNPRKLIAEADGIRIEVDVTMSAQIEFDPVIALPDEYHFDEWSYEDIVSAARYFQKEYKNLIGMENPQMDIYGGDHTIDGRQNYGIAFYDEGSTDEENLINYNFNRVSFVTREENCLWLVRIHRPDLSEKMGDYPIIDVGKAKELLLNGHYITSVPYELTEENYIVKAELIYRIGETEKYYIPYYRFYIELPELEGMAGEGTKTYGAYYVPAVESAYISDMSVWDGRLN